LLLLFNVKSIKQNEQLKKSPHFSFSTSFQDHCIRDRA